MLILANNVRVSHLSALQWHFLLNANNYAHMHTHQNRRAMLGCCIRFYCRFEFDAFLYKQIAHTIHYTYTHTHSFCTLSIMIKRLIYSKRLSSYAVANYCARIPDVIRNWNAFKSACGECLPMIFCWTSRHHGAQDTISINMRRTWWCCTCSIVTCALNYISEARALLLLSEHTQHIQFQQYYTLNCMCVSWLNGRDVLNAGRLTRS